jgi:hypothetical protein
MYVTLIFKVTYVKLAPLRGRGERLNHTGRVRAPVLKEAAAKFGKEARIVEDDSNDEKGTCGTTWVLFADSDAAFAQEPLAGAVEALTAERSIRLWTDDYSDLYAILK